MTTWYKEDRGAASWVAFSVRPDIWPPGSYCWSRARAGYMTLADWADAPSILHPDLANGTPGAAEALILAGQVVQETSLGVVWVEIPDPRTKGAA